jgi:twitching motility protein PilU
VDINKLLTLMAEKGASDAFITADAPPSIKLNGKLMPVGPTALTADGYSQCNDRRPTA